MYLEVELTVSDDRLNSGGSGEGKRKGFKKNSVFWDWATG
jgi:hypothetical protein